MIKLNDWNRCCEYAAFECAEFPNISWSSYTMYDGRKGIDLHSLDDLGNIYDTVNCGVCDSFKEFKESFWRNMGLLNRKELR